jgi:hypothetical protein
MQYAESQATPSLPTLGDQCYLLETGEATTGPLQSLVLDHLLLNEGDAYWVDAAGHAQADTLARIAPSNRLLERINVARGFTAYQHAALVNRVTDFVDKDTSIVVAPDVDAMYRSDDIRGPDPETMLRTAVERLSTLCQSHGIPVILTCRQRDDLSASVAEHVEDVIRCESTQFGPRFVGDGFETLVYSTGDGYVQTTLAFWKHVLTTRAETNGAIVEVAHGAN